VLLLPNRYYLNEIEMSRIITVGKDSLTFEVTKPVVGWKPQEGQVFYAPDLMSLMLPVKEFVWSGNQTDYMLYYDGMVYSTSQEARERYHVLKTLIRFVDAQ
jgi:hypothetical protein